MTETTDGRHLAALRTHWRRHKAFPAMAKLAGTLGLSSSGSVFAVVGRLTEAGYSGQPRALLLRNYPVCVEPLSALVMRLLALEQGEHQLPVPVGSAQYASLSIYRGPTIEESRLIEHLVARTVPLTDELSSLQVEFADELEERTTSIVVKPHRSPWGLLERAASRLWWAGGPPTALRSLSDVPVLAGEGVGLVREVDIPAYARGRLVRHLGGFRGPSHDAFFAEDWQAFLGSLQ